MWYSCTTLALELKIEVLYKRDDGVWNMFVVMYVVSVIGHSDNEVMLISLTLQSPTPLVP